MKNLLFILLTVFLSVSCMAQNNMYSAKRIVALDSLFLKDKWILGLNISPSLTSTKPAQEAVSVAAVKSYIAAQLAASGSAYTFNNLSTPTNGTATVQVSIEDASTGTIEAEVHAISPGGYALVGKKVVKYEKSGGSLTILGVVTEIIPTAKKLLNVADFDFEINSATQGFQIVVSGETGIPLTWKVMWKKNPTTL